MDPLLPEPEPLVSLIEALRRLPGVGVRSARRMAYHLLQHDPQGADMLGRALAGAVRDLRSGQAFAEPGQPIRICVSAPLGDVQLDL